MSDRCDKTTRFWSPDRLNPVQGTFTLRPSAEAEDVTEVRAEVAPLPVPTRHLLLAWLGEGAREVGWALQLLPRSRWNAEPPAALGLWPALRHVHHLVVRETRGTLPVVQRELGEISSEQVPSSADVDGADAAWATPASDQEADALLGQLAGARFELLQRLERAPDDRVASIEPLLLRARQHELEHLTSLWRIALYWDSIAQAPTHGATGVPLHPADRLTAPPTPTPLQESH